MIVSLKQRIINSELALNKIETVYSINILPKTTCLTVSAKHISLNAKQRSHKFINVFHFRIFFSQYVVNILSNG